MNIHNNQGYCYFSSLIQQYHSSSINNYVFIVEKCEREPSKNLIEITPKKDGYMGSTSKF